VRLVKSAKSHLWYEMTVVSDDGDHLIVEGPYAEAADRDLGYTRLRQGDWFVEHYWRSRWYSVKAIHDQARTLKGWYCDIARPVEVTTGVVTSVDLDLDVWVSADASVVLTLDEDEFADSGIESTDPIAARHARDAVVELRDAAAGRFQTLLDPS
jgi:hypothetical protein